MMSGGEADNDPPLPTVGFRTHPASLHMYRGESFFQVPQHFMKAPDEGEESPTGANE